MGIGALVFLGCPFRMLQRLGGGDLNAVVGLGGFLAGVGVGVIFEKLGYSAGKTSVIPRPVGLPAILLAIGAIVMFLMGAVPAGPKPYETSGPPHAVWCAAFGIAIGAGVLLSLTGFCAVSAGRQVFTGPKKMLIGATLLVLGYGVFEAATGKFKMSFDGQPVAHTDHLWNVLSMALVGLTGVLAGGCPVRLIVLSGEGNGDAMVTAAGVLVGGAASHGLGLASTGAGPTQNGEVAVVVGLGVCGAYALLATIGQRRATKSTTESEG
jgi:YedE family putative selenium metabolism protein